MRLDLVYGRCGRLPAHAWRTALAPAHSCLCTHRPLEVWHAQLWDAVAWPRLQLRHLLLCAQALEQSFSALVNRQRGVLQAGRREGSAQPGSRWRPLAVGQATRQQIVWRRCPAAVCAPLPACTLCQPLHCMRTCQGNLPPEPLPACLDPPPLLLSSEPPLSPLSSESPLPSSSSEGAASPSPSSTSSSCSSGGTSSARLPCLRSARLVSRTSRAISPACSPPAPPAAAAATGSGPPIGARLLKRAVLSNRPVPARRQTAIGQAAWGLAVSRRKDQQERIAVIPRGWYCQRRQRRRRRPTPNPAAGAPFQATSRAGPNTITATSSSLQAPRGLWCVSARRGGAAAAATMPPMLPAAVLCEGPLGCPLLPAWIAAARGAQEARRCWGGPKSCSAPSLGGSGDRGKALTACRSLRGSICARSQPRAGPARCKAKLSPLS